MSKTSWLVLSAALNAVLVGFILQQFVGRDQPASPSATPSAARSASSPRHDTLPASDDAFRSEPRSGRTGNILPQSSSVSGSNSVSTGMLKDFVRRLRAAGASETMIADFVAAQFDRQWEDQTRDLSRRIRRGEVDPRQRSILYSQWQDSRETAMKTALGDAAFTQWDKQRVLAQFDVAQLSLTPDEQDALYKLQKDRQDHERDLSLANQLGEIDRYDFQDQRTAQQKDYDQQLEQLLGTARGLQIKQDNDWNLGRVRWDLRNLNLTDSQLTALYNALQQSNDKQQEFQRLQQSGTPVDGAKWQELQAAKDQAVQSAIGEQGLAEYKMTQDNRYRQMQQFSTAWQLSDNDISHVYQVLKDNAQAAKDFRQQAQADAAAGQKVDWNQVNQGVESLKTQTEADLHGYLGDDRFTKLKRAGIIQLNY